ncbi:uncharacterized protein E5676_scaffold3861G00130 [Cucumis melo var. makuwa]|uniref:Uncharacterized protein n=1 Tax=Cucumis melo var. makuwa TaxID=1194695 RepID=A0A5D3D865_CUCMM|nr:uncharacterized protein E5676_scaffold3861G00130 [Cucumis melo var. makuwa]
MVFLQLVEIHGKISQYRGACRGGRRGRGAGRTQPEEQPAVHAANSCATITQAYLTAMENRYKDMLRDALTLLHIARQTLQPLLKPQWYPESPEQTVNKG